MPLRHLGLRLRPLYCKEYRRTKYSLLSRLSPCTDDLAADTPDPELYFLTGEENRRLWQAFSSLEESHRLLLSCYVLEWCSARDVQSRLHTSYPRMRRELECAKQDLRQRYLSVCEPQLH